MLSSGKPSAEPSIVAAARLSSVDVDAENQLAGTSSLI